MVSLFNYHYLGFERDNDAIYSYFEVDNIASVKKLEIINHIMHELFTDQINLMHIWWVEKERV